MHKYIFLSLLATVLSLSYASAVNVNKVETDTTVVDSVRALFYLDGIQVTYQKIADEYRKNNIADSWGADSKYAIMNYGEKARYGIYFFETIKKEEDDEK